MRVGIEDRAVFEYGDVVGKRAGFDRGFLACFRIPATNAFDATGAAVDATVGCQCDSVGFARVVIEECLLAGFCIHSEQLITGDVGEEKKLPSVSQAMPSANWCPSEMTSHSEPSAKTRSWADKE